MERIRRYSTGIINRLISTTTTTYQLMTTFARVCFSLLTPIDLGFAICGTQVGYAMFTYYFTIQLHTLLSDVTFTLSQTLLPFSFHLWYNQIRATNNSSRRRLLYPKR